MQTTIAIVILVIILATYYSKKNKRKMGKKWIVLEHEELEGENSNKCYYAQHKKNGKKSPCFRNAPKLNTWIQQNAKQTS